MYTSNWNTEKLDHSYAASNSNAGDFKSDFKYNESRYGSDDKSSSQDYSRKDEESKMDGKKSGLEESFSEQKKDDIQDDEIPFHAARQVFSGQKFEQKIARKHSKKSIEDAIRKAIEEERNVVIADN